MLDPLFIVFELFHSLSFLHSFAFALFWWRSVCEVFLQYGPLIRQPLVLYRIVLGIPAVVLLFASLSMSEFLGNVALTVSPVLAVLAILFFVRAGNTQGRLALIVHIIAGTGTMLTVYIMNAFRIGDSLLNDEFGCQTIEITMLGCYAMFQMVFQMGERSEEAEEHIAKPKKYEKIEEILEALTRVDEEVRFEIAES